MPDEMSKSPVATFERATTMDAILSVARQIAERFRPECIILFGSHAHGQATPDSDVDLLVEFAAGKKTLDNFVALSFLLEELLGRRVELVTPESLSPYVGPCILREVEYVTFTV